MNKSDSSGFSRRRLRDRMESLATFGLILVAAGLVAPFAGFENMVWNVVFRYVFSSGALIYTVARVVGSLGKDEQFRIRRLRRLETWAGFAFCAAAFFWFYNTSKVPSDTLTFRMLNETILFTLVGALIQIIASWMLSSAMRKQKKSDGRN